ncbi:MAG: hypothetical protein ACI8PT_004641 [Gammaproteobacteria bacterium]|jgi:hypothetical protein
MNRLCPESAVICWIREREKLEDIVVMNEKADTPAWLDE